MGVKKDVLSLRGEEGSQARKKEEEKGGTERTLTTKRGVSSQKKK